VARRPVRLLALGAAEAGYAGDDFTDYNTQVRNFRSYMDGILKVLPACFVLLRRMRMRDHAQTLFDARLPPKAVGPNA